MSQSIKISDKAYQKIMERKPEGMSRIDFMDRLVETAITSLEIQEEMRVNQNEILYKLRKMWNLIHPAPDFEKEKADAKTEEERKEIEDKEFRAYLKNLTEGREEECNGTLIRGKD